MAATRAHRRSLTKPAAPGLRVAALAARGAGAARLRAIRMVDDSFVAGTLQETALELVTAPSWPRHPRRIRKALQERRDTLVAAVRENLGAIRAAGGFSSGSRCPRRSAMWHSPNERCYPT